MKTVIVRKTGDGSGLKRAFESARKDVAYWQEDLLLKIADQLSAVMEEAGISRAELARRLGVSAPYVTKILRGHENMTLATLAAVAFALEKRWDCQLANLGVHIRGGQESALARRREANAYKFPTRENNGLRPAMVRESTLPYEPGESAGASKGKASKALPPRAKG